MDVLIIAHIGSTIQETYICIFFRDSSWQVSQNTASIINGLMAIEWGYHHFLPYYLLCALGCTNYIGFTVDGEKGGVEWRYDNPRCKPLQRVAVGMTERFVGLPGPLCSGNGLSKSDFSPVGLSKILLKYVRMCNPLDLRFLGHAIVSWGVHFKECSSGIFRIGNPRLKSHLQICRHLAGLERCGCAHLSALPGGLVQG